MKMFCFILFSFFIVFPGIAQLQLNDDTVNYRTTSISTPGNKTFPVQLSPNQVTGKLTISITDNETRIKMIKIFNSDGEQVKTESFDTNYKQTAYTCPCLGKRRINMRKLEAGTYHIRIYTNNDGIIVRTFVKK